MQRLISPHGLTSHDLRQGWHSYGMLCRSDNNWPEAIKCFRNALRFDKNPYSQIGVLRELSALLVQTEDYEGYLDTRSQILALKNNQRSSWMGYVFRLYVLKLDCAVTHLS